MGIAVPFLSKKEIETSAALLLVDFGGLRNGGSIKPPVPIEEVLEKHLRLTLDFDDLHGKLRIPRDGEEPEVLGALWAESGEVFIDESLDPDEHPEREGRYRFTLAHEVGHWCLHKDYLTSPAQQEADLFGHGHAPTVICRASQAKEPIERQADLFAASLLMPEGWVRIIWRELFSRSNPMVFSAFRDSDSDWAKPPIGWRGLGPLAAPVADAFDGRALEYFFYRASAPMAEAFDVSVQAMRFRLEQLGLLLIDNPRQQSLAFST
ncbi:MAG TPA: ImmA/IrrE family metallo-endopeptidase [Methyloceanibacter sp.]|nr:ImmA/IrrE family metallo-endopeptidase [Methyloceanibacter sp.]